MFKLGRCDNFEALSDLLKILSILMSHDSVFIVYSGTFRVPNNFCLLLLSHELRETNVLLAITNIFVADPTIVQVIKLVIVVDLILLVYI